MDDSSGTHFTFPLERVRREWLLVVCERWEAEAKPVMQPVKFANDPTMPFWSHRLRHGDLPLDKVKDWTTRWHDSGAAHPRVFCDPADLPAIRERVAATPALRDNYAQSRQIHVADRYLMEGDAGIATVLADGGALAAIEATTIGKELLLGILERGYIGPSYAIALTRPMRRYAMACDMMWHSFNDAEKADARWVCAVSAYIMSDGDWWQFAWRAGETTYLPNFNSDVYCAAGLIGLFLADHPCTAAWTGYFARRVELELERHIRVDGGGEENLGSYYHSTWMQLLMPSLWALRHAGVRDYSGDSRVAGAAQFVLKILTPPDPREANKRFFPPIGHHPHARKAFSYLAQLASFIHRAKPRLAEHLMWAWEASGSPVGNLHDHKGPTANPFTRHYVFHDPTIPPVAPVLLSANLPHVGAVMRSHDASGQGSYLLIKAGRIHSHHDPDEGSFHYFGRGVPLALDGLRLANGSNAREHNGLSFPADGQPTARIEQFVSTPGADYLRARALPRGFSIDPMYLDNLHRSGFVRELLMVKADAPGGVEYVVVKDVALGPDAPTWNLDVLSRQPEVHGNRVWFPGHPEFAMGMDVIVVEPFGECDSETGEPAATSSLSGMEIAPGVVNPDLLDPEKRAKLPAIHVRYTIHEHWHLHLPAGPGETFLVVLFPRRPGESVPIIEYLAREEVLVITHDEGRDLVFLRSNTAIPLNLDGVTFQGHSGVVRDRHTAPAGGAVRTLVPLDAFDMARTADRPGPDTLR